MPCCDAEHVLEDQLDPLQPGTAPLTAARYVASTLNHLANELITSADYPAALRTLVFSRAVCTHELKVRSARWQGPNGRAMHDSDTNEVRASYWRAAAMPRLVPCGAMTLTRAAFTQMSCTGDMSGL